MVEPEVADMVILPIDGIVTGVRAGVPPVPGQVKPLVGRTGPGQREQVTSHLDRDVAGEGLGLRDRDRAAGRLPGIAGDAAPLLERGRGGGEQRLGRAYLGGEPSETVDGV